MRKFKRLLCTSILLTGSVFAKPQPLDGIAAIVNDTIITKSELAQQVKIIGQQIQRSGTAVPEISVLEKQVLDHLILNEVQLQIAKRSGITITEAGLDNAIDNIAKQNHMTVTQLREALAREGLDFDFYRNNVRHQMEISQLQQRDILSNIHISEQEISQFLQSPNGLGGMVNEFRLGHILIPLPDAPTTDELNSASQKAKEIVSDLRKGKDFAQMAFAESKGEQALSGGDLGWRKLAELPTIFEKIVTALNANDIADPIRSSSGFHIIKLLDKRSSSQIAQTTVEKSLVRHILIKKNANTSDNDAKQRLTEIRQKILNGEDFAKLAKTHSADLASASNGGSIGWVSREVLAPEFSGKMETLAVEEISEPFATPFGWHIVQVLDRKSQTNDETALRQKAKEMIQQRRFEEKMQMWVRQIVDEAYVKKYDES
ncbi:MAG: peptidylprolyl isomerase [Candidatus Berkiellales bacterium]